jgi:hypothetical protein
MTVPARGAPLFSMERVKGIEPSSPFLPLRRTSILVNKIAASMRFHLA